MTANWSLLALPLQLGRTGSLTQGRSQVGDVLAVDNEVCMHGRCSFDGSERKMYSSFSRL